LSEEDIIDNLENETKINCSQVFSAYIDEKRLTEDFKTHDANNTIFEAFRINTLKKIQENIVVIENKIENLLVDPETQKIKEQGSDISIFQLLPSLKTGFM
jgi:phage terminase small subunit